MPQQDRHGILVLRAQGGDASAFNKLVRDFQDMAVAYAYTLLGDFHRAEDAAQDAFLSAYQKLSTLRDPAAFPGWFRAIVRSQCNRAVRRKRLTIVKIDEAGVPEVQAAPANDGDEMDEILAAVRGLPEVERSVVSLFYVSAYTHKEIADFLGLEVTTVQGRLRLARERLKERMLTMAKRRLSEHAPSRDARFSDRVKRLVRPEDLKSEQEMPWSGGKGTDVWTMIRASIEGDLNLIRELVANDSQLVNCYHQYRRPLHFAVQEGHVEVVRFLLEQGADATYQSGNRWHERPIVIAEERGHVEVAGILEEHLGGTHQVTESGERLAAMLRNRDDKVFLAALDEDASLVHTGDARGNLPIHWATLTRNGKMIDALLDRGADVNAQRPDGARPLDLHSGDYWFRKNRDVPPMTDEEHRAMIDHLVDRGAIYDISIAARIGDSERVKRLLEEDPSLANRVPDYCTYYNGVPLWAAVGSGHRETIDVLLEAGAVATTPEPQMAPQGRVLMAAVGPGDLDLIRTFLDQGADPNAGVESSGTAMGSAISREKWEVLKLMASYGGTVPEYQDMSTVDAAGLEAVYRTALPLQYYVDVEDVKTLSSRFDEDPGTIKEAVALTLRGNNLMKLDVLRLCLDRDPDVAKTVHSNSVIGLLHRVEEDRVIEPLRWLLEAGMTPNDPNWMRVTPLHRLVVGEWAHGTDGSNYRSLIKSAQLFIEYGADLEARDEEYSSTPLGWAARWGREDTVALLLERGAKTNLPDDPPWATPLAWARKKGHDEVERLLIEAGASQLH